MKTTIFNTPENNSNTAINRMLIKRRIRHYITMGRFIKINNIVKCFKTTKQAVLRAMAEMEIDLGYNFTVLDENQVLGLS